MLCTGDKSLGGHRALLCRGRGDVAGKRLSGVIGWALTENRENTPHKPALTLPLLPQQGSEETIRVVSMDKDYHVECYHCEVGTRHHTCTTARLCHPTARLCHSLQPLGRCCLAPQGALAALTRRGRWVLPLGSWRHRVVCWMGCKWCFHLQYKIKFLFSPMSLFQKLGLVV